MLYITNWQLFIFCCSRSPKGCQPKLVLWQFPQGGQIPYQWLRPLRILRRIRFTESRFSRGSTPVPGSSWLAPALPDCPVPHDVPAPHASKSLQPNDTDVSLRSSFPRKTYGITGGLDVITNVAVKSPGVSSPGAGSSGVSAIAEACTESSISTPTHEHSRVARTTGEYISDVTWALWRLKSLTTWLFIQQLVQASNKYNWNEVHITVPFWIQHKGPGGRFNNAYELLNLRALKISMLYKSHIFQCMGKIFCVEFQRVPLSFEIPHKISYTYIERYIFYETLKL